MDSKQFTSNINILQTTRTSNSNNHVEKQNTPNRQSSFENKSQILRHNRELLQPKYELSNIIHRLFTSSTMLFCTLSWTTIFKVISNMTEFLWVGLGRAVYWLKAKTLIILKFDHLNSKTSFTFDYLVALGKSYISL